MIMIKETWWCLSDTDLHCLTDHTTLHNLDQDLPVYWVPNYKGTFSTSPCMRDSPQPNQVFMLNHSVCSSRSAWELLCVPPRLLAMPIQHTSVWPGLWCQWAYPDTMYIWSRCLLCINKIARHHNGMFTKCMYMCGLNCVWPRPRVV